MRETRRDDGERKIKRRWGRFSPELELKIVKEKEREMIEDEGIAESQREEKYKGGRRQMKKLYTKRCI